jgi:hypothetical protein
MPAADREQIAREALFGMTSPDTVGPLLVEQPEADEHIVTLRFASAMPGYPGWQWAVSVSELDGLAPTVLETELVPADGALLAPDWVPWSERLDDWRAAQEALADEVDELDPEDEDEVDDADDDDTDDDDTDDDDTDDDFDVIDEDELAAAPDDVDEQDEPEAEAGDGRPEPPAEA